jgi:hypothetical protein
LWDSAASFITFSVTSTSQEVAIVYTPDSGGDKRAYINGFEVDKADVKTQVQFPYPLNADEHIDLESDTGLTASWKAPKSASSPTYNVYLGTTRTNMKILTTTTSTSATLSGKHMVFA